MAADKCEIKRQALRDILDDLNKANSARAGVEFALRGTLQGGERLLESCNFVNALEVITDYITLRLEDMDRLITAASK